ncbi:MAG: hypothetical protein IMF19_14045, partial [Proteobacteria bacterium]|nr:hypothetical protein [Pseudomonadota bacterium]
LLLSPTPMSINKTKVDVSEILNGIWRARDRVNAIAGWITIISCVAGIIFFAYKWQKTKKREIGKKRIERSSFVKTGIIKINKEFEAVSICSVNDYPFKLGGYTVSLKIGESLIIPQPLPDLDDFKYLMIAGWGFAKKDRLFSWENVPGNDS